MPERRGQGPVEREEGLIRALAAGARLEPPENADRLIRRMIAGRPPAPARPPSPLPLVLTAVTSLILLAVALGASLSRTALSGDAPLVAAIVVTAYLGLSATAVLPLLVRRDLLRAVRALGVRS